MHRPAYRLKRFELCDLGHGVEADSIAFGIQEEAKESESLTDFGLGNINLATGSFDSVKHYFEIGAAVEINLRTTC